MEFKISGSETKGFLECSQIKEQDRFQVFPVHYKYQKKKENYEHGVIVEIYPLGYN